MNYFAYGQIAEIGKIRLQLGRIIFLFCIKTA